MMEPAEYSARVASARSAAEENVWIVKDFVDGSPCSWKLNDQRMLRGVPFEASALLAAALLKAGGYRRAAPPELTFDAMAAARSAAMERLRAERAAEIDAEFAKGVRMKILKSTWVDGRRCAVGETVIIKGSILGRRLIRGRQARRV